LDTLWWKDYIAKYVGDLIEERRRAFAKELDSALERGLSISDWMEIRDKAYAKLWAEAVNKVSEYLGLSEDEARILSSLTGPLSWDDFKRACEDFKSEIERWKNVMEALGYTIERNPWLNYGFKKYTTLPKMSNKLTNDAWKWWESR